MTTANDYTAAITASILRNHKTAPANFRAVLSPTALERYAEAINTASTMVATEGEGFSAREVSDVIIHILNVHHDIEEAFIAHSNSEGRDPAPAPIELAMYRGEKHAGFGAKLEPILRALHTKERP